MWCWRMSELTTEERAANCQEGASLESLKGCIMWSVADGSTGRPLSVAVGAYNPKITSVKTREIEGGVAVELTVENA